jgi:hypothetical protein
MEELAALHGHDVRYEQTFALAEDETCIHLFDAGSREAPTQASRKRDSPTRASPNRSRTEEERWISARSVGGVRTTSEISSVFRLRAPTHPAPPQGTYIARGRPTVTDTRTAGPTTFVTESVPALYAGEVSAPYVAAGIVHFMSDGSFTDHATVV